MLLRTFFSGEPRLTQEILKGLRDPMWSTLMSTTHQSDNYDVNVNDDRAIYRMIIAGRNEEEIDIDVINDYLVVKAKKVGWIPAQEFQFGLPSRRDAISAKLIDGILTVEVAIAKRDNKVGKIVINKEEKK
jgi:HSP20 family molecular chaperone IbpA